MLPTRCCASIVQYAASVNTTSTVAASPPSLHHANVILYIVSVFIVYSCRSNVVRSCGRRHCQTVLPAEVWSLQSGHNGPTGCASCWCCQFRSTLTVPPQHDLHDAVEGVGMGCRVPEAGFREVRDGEGRSSRRTCRSSLSPMQLAVAVLSARVEPR